MKKPLNRPIVAAHRLGFMAVPVLAALNLTVLTAFAQQAPSLAVAGVQASPFLVKKFPPPAEAATAAVPSDSPDAGATTLTGTWTGPGGRRFLLDFTRSDSAADQQPNGGGYPGASSDLPGDWKGTLVVGRVRSHLVLHLDKLADGSLSATMQNRDHGKNQPKIDGPATLVEYRAPRLRVEMPNRAFYEGNFNCRSASGAWVAPRPQLSPLEAVIHAIDVQVVDRIGAAKLFTLMEESDLKQVIAAPNGQSNQIYNLKNPSTAEQYKKAEINYLLVTTLEEFEDQTIDVMQGNGMWVTVSNQASKSVSEKREVTGTATGRRSRGRDWSEAETKVRGTREGSSNFASSGQMRAGQLDSSIKKEQRVHLAVRCRLFDVGSGALLQSLNHPFDTNRVYVALAAGNNAKATSDFHQAAAHFVADWAANRVTEAVFPIKVLEKEGGVITINRGQGAGLQVGQTYGVFAPGKELKDPDSGEVLGREEITVGKAAISELHPQFCKAKVWQDTGITSGAILRRLP